MKNYTIIFDKKTSTVSDISSLKGKKDISVVIPSYNEEENIINLIDKIADSLKDKYSFEVIIVDDASTDNTEKVLADKAKKDGANVIVFSEMVIPGYILGDMWERENFIT